jgi:hypothetical protein
MTPVRLLRGAVRYGAWASIVGAPALAGAQSLPASPASSTEKPGQEDTAPAKDDSGLLVTAAMRVRYETVGGRPRPDFARSEQALLVRTGVAVEYGPGPLTIGGELVDSRGYGIGSTSQLDNDDINALELPQAYLKLRLDHGTGPVGKVAIEGGRFLVNLGSGRLVATDEYRNTITGFTGLRVDLEPRRNTDISVFYLLPQERLPDGEDAIRRNVVRFDRETFDEVFFGAYVRQKQVFGRGQIEAAYYRLAEHDSVDRTTADRRLHTIDVRLSREPEARAYDYDFEGAYQFGRASDSTMADATNARVTAGFAHAAAGYSFGGPLKPRIGLFYDYASGNGRQGGTDGTSHRFDTLFGSRRDDFGPSGTYSALARENISAPGIRFEAKPTKRTEVLADYRGVWLASRYDRFYNILDRTGGSGRFGGQQVEGRLRYWVIPEHLRLESNFAVLFKGAFLKTAPEAIARDETTVRFIETNLLVTF